MKWRISSFYNSRISQLHVYLGDAEVDWKLNTKRTELSTQNKIRLVWKTQSTRDPED
jgi:hypothetical protein